MNAYRRRDGSLVPEGVGHSWRTYHCEEREYKTALGEEGREVHHDESSEGTFCKFRLGSTKRLWILRPQRGTFYQHFHRSLSDQNSLRVIYERWDGLRTKITEPSA